MAMNNYEQMREALVYARTVLAKWARDMPFRAWNEIGEAIDKCDAALAAPPRQCDVGTAEEQAERMDMFCKSHKHGFDGLKCYACENCKFISVDRCELAWAQMSYAEEGGAK